jgi:hypothetical protein
MQFAMEWVTQMNEVELLYNPYKNKSRITINDQVISPYSSLANFINEPFYKWCNFFIPQLENELNGRFNLTFISRDIETEIMRVLSNNSPLCEKFTAKEFIINTKLTKRMSQLNKMILNNQITKYTQKNIKANFFVSSHIEYFKEVFSALDIKNKYCIVEAETLPVSQLFNTLRDSVVFVVVNTLEEAKKLLKQLDNMAAYSFVLVLGSRSRFLNKISNCFIYETTDELLEQSIFECLLFIPLLNVFIECKNNAENEKVHQNVEYNLLDEIDPVITVKAQSRVEMGQAILLDKRIFPEHSQDIQLDFKYDNDNIAACDGRVIKGINEGKVNIEVYRKGELVPLTVLPIEVYKTNRIIQIFIDENYIIIPAGAAFTLRSSYIPEDADNSGDLKWLSMNESIARVESEGRIFGVSAGKTTIKCIVDRIEAKCEVYVKELLKDIKLSSQYIEIPLGGKHPLKYSCVPYDCYEEIILAYIENKNIISYDQGVVYGENIGETCITFHTKGGTIAEKCNIKVIGNAEESNSKKRKSGFFKSLFGG